MKKFLSIVFLFFMFTSVLSFNVDARPVLPPDPLVPNYPVKVDYPIQNVFVGWRSVMSDYNCYGYAIGVNEWKTPGYTMGSPWNASHSLSQLTSKVAGDLINLGYANVRTVSSSYQPQSNEYLIAFRLGYIVDFVDSNGEPVAGYVDYHFMRYNEASNQWTHKPGGTSVLRLMTNQSIQLTWLFEQYRVYSNPSLTGWYRDNFSSYNGTIVYLAYRNSLPTDPIQVMS